MFAYGRRWTSCVSVPLLSMRVMTPIGSPAGYSDGSRSVSETVPRVTTRSPGLSFAPGGDVAQQQVVGVARADRLDDAEDRRVLPARAETPAVVSLALVSVRSVTCAAPLKTAVTRPMSASSLRTGWPTRTPSLEPLSMRIVAYQTVGEVAMTRAGLRAVVLEAERAAGLDELAQLGVLVHRVVVDRELARAGGRARP